MGKNKELQGLVVSDKMQKTIVVKVMRLSRHAKYTKTVKHFNKFKAHDEKGLAKIGDEVSIIETRPLSKDKRFILKKVVTKAKSAQNILKEESI